jgi:maleylacetoacetate isomerase
MLRLYRAPFSTNCERVELALAYKGLEFEPVEIDYGDRGPVVRVSGQPLVPVLDDGGTVVADSTRILRYLERLRPEPPLFPSDPARSAELDIFLEWFNEVWKGPPNAIEAELGRASPDGERIAELAGRMDGWLDLFETLLEGRDHLLGEGVSAADFAAYPFLKYAAGREPADDELFHRVLDEYQQLGDRPRLAAWIRRMRALPRG